jgi:Predicted membrane protein
MVVGHLRLRVRRRRRGVGRRRTRGGCSKETESYPLLGGEDGRRKMARLQKIGEACSSAGLSPSGSFFHPVPEEDGQEEKAEQKQEELEEKRKEEEEEEEEQEEEEEVEEQEKEKEEREEEEEVEEEEEEEEEKEEEEEDGEEEQEEEQEEEEELVACTAVPHESFLHRVGKEGRAGCSTCLLRLYTSTSVPQLWGTYKKKSTFSSAVVSPFCCKDDMLSGGYFLSLWAATASIKKGIVIKFIWG